MNKEKLDIYKQEKNIEKANCDLTDMELFVTLADYKKLEQQLQAYKDKEDKLRDALEELKKEMWQNDRTDYMLGMSYVGIKVLQILNEGDK